MLQPFEGEISIVPPFGTRICLWKLAVPHKMKLIGAYADSHFIVKTSLTSSNHYMEDFAVPKLYFELEYKTCKYKLTDRIYPHYS